MEAPVDLCQREFIPSEDSFHADELTAELAGGAILGLFKDSVEVCNIVEAAVIADLADALFGFDEPAGRITNAGVVDIIDKSLSGAALDKPIEGNRTHIDQLRNFFQSYFAVIILLYIVIYLFDSLAVLEIIHL